MVSHFYTKYLQGKLFYKFRDQILGLAPMDDTHIHRDRSSVLENKKITKIDKAKSVNSNNELLFQNVEHGKVSWAYVVKGKTMTNGII